KETKGTISEELETNGTKLKKDVIPILVSYLGEDNSSVYENSTINIEEDNPAS
ncbi:4150_t:CDS:2, partial [Dentiscutata heterogama]